MTDMELMKMAEDVRQNSYSPYSDYCVGAALLAKSGKVYVGCNTESSSFTPTCCAERAALFHATSEGEREFVAIAIVGGRNGSVAPLCAPCGVCRQALAEFCDEDFRVILGNSKDGIAAYTLGFLLPFAFRKKEVRD